ncbi:MAG: DUF302 domain-containing protein [Labilithrix sp.]|nr:DUF302 domain-containing protein [Labilithrix sp.]
MATGIMERTTIDHPYRAVRRELGFAVGHADFTRALESLLGRIAPSALVELARDPPELAREKLGRMVGVSGLAIFQKIDHAAVLKALDGRDVPATTYVLGNALLAFEMTRHDPVAGLYLPPRLFVGGTAARGVRVTYDLPSATLAQFCSPQISAVAASLDTKIEKLVAVAAALATKTRPVRSSLGAAESSRR